MKYILTLLLLWSIGSKAQTELQFNHSLINCEDKWVAFPMNNDGTYNFGFIYLDNEAGLTLNVEGTFKIDEKGQFVADKIRNSMVKHRIPPTKVLAALIPSSKFSELQIQETPDWLKAYKTNENDVNRLFRLGFVYNQWDLADKALVYLEKVKTINPKYNGLIFEFAFAYNVLKQYDKAVVLLKQAIIEHPEDCLLHRELVYAQLNIKLTDAEETYKNAAKWCFESYSKSEMAHNIAYHYYLLKNKQKFNYWADEVAMNSKPEDQYAQKIKLMKAEMDKL
ncbi:tetratricopeptide repeat protein [Pedobacter sp. UBA5917]|jgi:tetratricopeptide (TPR) repeat protein|uniref:tetratricopeptide repeat protein n=1 Tax=Pedobacter sp. UBA5917 TaxID=1947061 RepID=UPI0025FB46CC|nr:tetratricopeptide repeat protein [Pedobacter sp. UBA5917]